MRFIAIMLLICGALIFEGCVESPRTTTNSVGLEDSTRPTPVGATDQRFSRNMVNTLDKNIPAEWSIREGAKKNIKWAAKIGTMRTGYLTPAIAGGKVFIAANNTEPSDPKITGDKAILKCFRESDGQFLWQIVHDMPPVEVQQKQA